MRRALKLAKAILADSDLTLGPAQNVCPDLAGVQSTDFHPLCTLGVADAAYGRATIRSLFRALTHPSDALRVVKVIDLVTVRVVLPSTDHVVKLSDRLLWVLAAAAVQVTEKDAGVTIDAEQDHAVSDRLELRRHPALEGLTDLSVVVVDQRNRVHRTGLRQCTVKDLAKIIVDTSFTSFLEIVVQGRVKD